MYFVVHILRIHVQRVYVMSQENNNRNNGDSALNVTAVHMNASFPLKKNLH